MSFTEIHQADAADNTPGGVRVTISRHGTQWLLHITLCQAVADRAGWRHGDTLAVEVGSGADEGWVRVRPAANRPAKYGRLPGAASKQGGGRIVCRAGTLGGRAQTRSMAEDWKVQDGALLILLPASWRQNAPAPSPSLPSLARARTGLSREADQRGEQREPGEGASPTKPAGFRLAPGIPTPAGPGAGLPITTRKRA